MSQQVSSDVVGQLKEHWTPEEGVRDRGLSFLHNVGFGEKDIYHPLKIYKHKFDDSLGPSCSKLG